MCIERKQKRPESWILNTLMSKSQKDEEKSAKKTKKGWPQWQKENEESVVY